MEGLPHVRQPGQGVGVEPAPAAGRAADGRERMGAVEAALRLLQKS